MSSKNRQKALLKVEEKIHKENFRKFLEMRRNFVENSASKFDTISHRLFVDFASIFLWKSDAKSSSSLRKFIDFRSARNLEIVAFPMGKRVFSTIYTFHASAESGGKLSKNLSENARISRAKINAKIIRKTERPILQGTNNF